MPINKFNRVTNPFEYKGLMLATPPNMLSAGMYTYVRNVRSVLNGTIEARKGLVKQFSTLLPNSVHSIFNINNPLSGSTNPYAYLIGAGTSLYSDNATHSILLNRQSGFSGNPFTFATMQPPRSPEGWGYIGDASKIGKINSAGTFQNWGILPPNHPPTINLADGPQYSIIDTMDNATTSGWALTGATSTLADTGVRFSTTINQIIFDAGTTGWACIVPTAVDEGMQPGALFHLDFTYPSTAGANHEVVRISSVGTAIPATSILSIQYETGSTGACSIVLLDNFGIIKPYNVLKLNNGATTEYVIIREIVNTSPTRQVTIKASTVATFAAGNSVEGVRSIRVWCGNTHIAGETLVKRYLSAQVTPSGIGGVEKAVTLSLASIGNTNRATKNTDLIHISLLISGPENLTEGKIMFNVDAVDTTFTENYYYKDFRANDLTPAVQDISTTLPTLQVALQRQYIEDTVYSDPRSNYFYPINPYPDDPYPVGTTINPSQTAIGSNQWTELVFKVGDLIRVGTDSSRGLESINRIRISFNTSGIMPFFVDSWWIGGGYGLQSTLSNSEFAYRYRYTGYNSGTGEESNPSPETRNGVNALGEGVKLDLLQHSDTQVDKLKIYRIGGTLLDYSFVGMADNTATPTFVDEITDLDAFNNQIIYYDNYKPFPDLDLPRSGICNVVGTEITRVGGDSFNTAWDQGSQIIINGVVCTLYNSPSSTERLSIVQSLGNLNNVSFLLPGATLQGQPLPYIFGPYGGGVIGEIIFACGSNRQPGTLFWTIPGNPGASKGQLTITDPTDRLVNGCIYDGRPYVFSLEHMYMVTPTFSDENAEGRFVAQEVANTVGLFSPYALCVGELIYYLGKDGIYASEGGQSRNITNESLYPIFPHDGVAGQAVNDIQPPDLSRTNDLRLSYYDGFLYFNYVDILGAHQSLIYDTRRNLWYHDVYLRDNNLGLTAGATYHYGDVGTGRHKLLVGGTTGYVYYMDGLNDDGNAFNPVVRTPSLSLGDPGVLKQWGDLWLQTHPYNNILTVTPYYNSYVSSLTPMTITGNAIKTSVIDLNDGNGILTTDIGMEITWQQHLLNSPLLYWWSASHLEKEENVIRRATDWDDADYSGLKYVQGIIIRADTENEARSIQVQYDGGTNGPLLMVQHNGEQEKGYPNTFSKTWIPFEAHLMRLFPLDNLDWKLYNWRWIWEPAPEYATHWETQETTHDMQGYLHLDYELYLAIKSTATVTLTIIVDGVSRSYSIASTNGEYKKVEVTIGVHKGKAFKYKLTSSEGFQVFQKDCEVRVKAWNSPEPFISTNPFGDLHRQSGAKI